METKICKNCLRIHIVDERVSKPTCKCIKPEVVSLKKYFEYIHAVFPVFFNDYVRDFVKKHSLYEFAFSCYGEPYVDSYSQNIKLAVLYRAVFMPRAVERLLNSDEKLLFGFFKGFDIDFKKYVIERNHSR